MQMQEHFDEFFEVTFMSHSPGWAPNASQWMCCWWHDCSPIMWHIACIRTHIFLKHITIECRLSYSTLPNQEVFSEMEEKYGEVEEMNICDNLGDHLVGNVYVKVSVASFPHNCYSVALFTRMRRKWVFLSPLICLSVLLCSSVTKKMPRRLWLIWTIDGLTDSPSMLSSLRSQTSEKRAVGSMRWGECYAVVSPLKSVGPL